MASHGDLVDLKSHLAHYFDGLDRHLIYQTTSSYMKGGNCLT
jgi:hypothetical protein